MSTYMSQEPKVEEPTASTSGQPWAEDLIWLPMNEHEPMSNAAQADPAVVAGQAGRISKADKDAAALAAQHAQLRMTIEITRAGTGKKETFELVGTPMPNQPIEE